MQQADDGLLAGLDRADARLDLEDEAPVAVCAARGVQVRGGAAAAAARRRVGAERARRRCSRDVQSRGEGALAGAREHDGAYVCVVRQRGEGAPELRPHVGRNGVELVRPVDLDMCDVLGGEGDAEVGDLVLRWVWHYGGLWVGKSCRL